LPAGRLLLGDFERQRKASCQDVIRPCNLTPPAVNFGSMPVPPVPMPGKTKLVRTWLEG
jgi:hypothetical protein